VAYTSALEIEKASERLVKTMREVFKMTSIERVTSFVEILFYTTLLILFTNPQFIHAIGLST
jgi:hypothetical protein